MINGEGKHQEEDEDHLRMNIFRVIYVINMRVSGVI